MSVGPAPSLHASRTAAVNILPFAFGLSIAQLWEIMIPIPIRYWNSAKLCSFCCGTCRPQRLSVDTGLRPASQIVAAKRLELARQAVSVGCHPHHRRFARLRLATFRTDNCTGEGKPKQLRTSRDPLLRVLRGACYCRSGVMLDVFEVDAGITLRHRSMICSARCNSAAGGCGSRATPPNPPSFGIMPPATLSDPES
jgi:hypothetical protein